MHKSDPENAYTWEFTTYSFRLVTTYCSIEGAKRANYTWRELLNTCAFVTEYGWFSRIWKKHAFVLCSNFISKVDMIHISSPVKNHTYRGSQYQTSTSLHRYEVKLFWATFLKHKKCLFELICSVAFLSFKWDPLLWGTSRSVPLRCIWKAVLESCYGRNFHLEPTLILEIFNICFLFLSI